MPFTRTTATNKIAAMDKRIRLAAGGTSASKTISILLYLISRCHYDIKCGYCNTPWGCKYIMEPKKHSERWTNQPTLTSVVSESFPHLRRGAMRDFLNIMEQHGYYREERWSKTDFTYTFETGSKLEFFSADQAGKVRGPRRDRLFCNEVNNITKESWDQLLLRTREFAFADWNPVADFFMYDDYGLNDDPVATTTDPDVDFVILTYKDNEALEPSIVNEIEKRRPNKHWFRPYGEGKRGELEGKIFKNWQIIDEIPHEARLEVRGLDFGYARDPLALCDIYYYNGGYIIDELAYRTGMLNRQAADIILNQADPNVLTIADSAEQKSIAEMQEYGVNVIGVQKKGLNGVPFTNSAIGWVQEQQMSITKRSTNFIKSYRNFMWQTDKDGVIIDKYDHYYSDGMMAVVYGMTNFTPSSHKAEEENLTTGALANYW